MRLDIRTKLRFLNRVARVFPVWATERQARTIEKAFDADLSKAKGWEARSAIEQQRDFEASEYWDALRELRSHELLRRARKLHIPLSKLNWTTGNYGHRYLEGESELELYRATRDERRKTWEFRVKVIVALTGLVGTMIGLVSVWKKR